MKKLIFTLFLINMINQNAIAQSFVNIDELLQLSEMDPLELEKTVISKGLKFIKTDGLKSSYANSRESLEYMITPRTVIYTGLDRIFFLEVNSKIIKEGFVLVSAEAVLQESQRTVKAQQYQKGKFTVWLHTSEESDGTNYIVQIDNSSPSSVKKLKTSTGQKTDFKYKGDKSRIDYGYFYIGLINPRGTITETPKANTTYAYDYAGMSGIGAKKGFEFGIGGVLGITGLNKKLPYFMDFGVWLGADFGVQPYSYESLGAPYDDYVYNGFWRAGGGVGPSMVITPFREADFHISFVYKVQAGGTFGGTFKYDGGDFNSSLVRDEGYFSLIKTYGVYLHGGSLFGGVDFSSYVDKGTFIYRESYTAGNIANKVTFTANLPVNQINVKIGLAF